MLTFDAAGAGGISEGPLFGSKSFTYGLTSRVSSLSFLDKIGIIDFGGVPQYKNGHFKLNYKKGALLWNLNLIGGDDVIEGDVSKKFTNGMDSTKWRQKVDYTQSSTNLFAGTRFTYKQERGTSSIYAAWNTKKSNNVNDIYQNYVSGDTLILDSLFIKEEAGSRGSKWIMGADKTHAIGRSWTLGYGYLHDYVSASSSNAEKKNAFLESNPIDSLNYSFDHQIESQFFSLGAYAELIRQGRTMDFYLGYRQLYDEFTGKSLGGPRIGIKRYFKGYTVKYGGGMHTQSPAVSMMLANLPEGTGELPFSLQNVLGLEVQLPLRTMFNMEVYHKQNYNQLRLYPISSNIVLTQFHGKSRSTGVDLYLKKELSHGVWSTLSYTYAHSRAYWLGKWAKYEYSIPHSLTSSLGYTINKKFNCSLRFTTASGSPYTVIPESIRLEQLEKRFNRTTKASQRLDIRFDHRSNYKKISIISFIEITNVLNHQNTYAIEEFDLRKGWGFFPVGGVRMAF